MTLPGTVTAAEWALERNQYQNARIRTLLGTIDLLEAVLDSNYAILHCSPARLQEIWRQVHQVAEVIRTRVASLFEHPSVIPELEEVLQSTRSAIELLSRDLLARLDRYPSDIPREQLTEVRKLLCVSIGQLHAFLQDTFGAVMAADPRSKYDKDYFLSRRFSRDIEEAEWLHRSVVELDNFLQGVADDSSRVLGPMVRRLESERTLLSTSAWRAAEACITRLVELTGKLREVLALRGIRFDEMEVLDRYSQEIPDRCNRLLALQGAGREAITAMMDDPSPVRSGREQTVVDLVRCHAVFSRRIAGLARNLLRAVQDLASFLPIWLVAINNRRALLLYRTSETASGDPRPGRRRPARVLAWERK